jgi:hypothetical protein
MWTGSLTSVIYGLSRKARRELRVDEPTTTFGEGPALPCSRRLPSCLRSFFSSSRKAAMRAWASHHTQRRAADRADLTLAEKLPVGEPNRPICVVSQWQQLGEA